MHPLKKARSWDRAAALLPKYKLRAVLLVFLTICALMQTIRFYDPPPNETLGLLRLQQQQQQHPTTTASQPRERRQQQQAAFSQKNHTQPALRAKPQLTSNKASLARRTSWHQITNEELGLLQLTNYSIRAERAAGQPSDIDSSIDCRDQVELVTQMTIDKWSRLVSLAERWSGSISCALYLRPKDNVAQLVVPPNVDLHFLLGSELYTGDYPMNRLRNLALDKATSAYVLPIDVDFMPSDEFLPQICRLLRSGWHDQLRQKKVLVLPAFERFLPPNATKQTEDVLEVPHTKTDLMVSLQTGESAPFHLSFFPDGHGPTKFDDWYTSSEPYAITWKPRFEPYIVAFRQGLPRYWNGMTGFGYNKLAWMTELAAAGYQFYVAPSAFVIHKNHALEMNAAKSRPQRIASRQTHSEYFEKFGSYLKERYNFTGGLGPKMNRYVHFKGRPEPEVKPIAQQVSEQEYSELMLQLISLRRRSRETTTASK